ncbi:alpha/beta hydrolase [Porphyrobacter sp. YT40]|uniref:alpha/beta hydrolase n=1 Tax=Porphyrobacter sp. YT40 TaxID=2547601 RepID=UPI0011438821|nr:alpha/beta hydrolase [Porphyrobacter sp. YT40]QDH34299.1 alpha/beta fold hydrolase [Porphyrobacter sp. YT40]
MEDMAAAQGSAFEQRALVTALLRAAQIYRIAAQHVAWDDLAVLLGDAAQARERLAAPITARTGVEVEDPAALAIGLEDPARAAQTGLGPLREIIARAEAQIAEVLEDVSPGSLTPDETAAAHAMVAEFQAALTALVRAAAASGVDPVRPSPKAQEEKNIYRVGFATTRVPALKGDKVTDFTGERGEVVHYGFCDVVIPENRRIGTTGSPWWRRIFTGDDRLHYDRPEVAGAEDLWAWMRERIGGEGADDALVFIHGYNVSFREAALQTAQIGADLGFTGAMSFFSWPSRGRLLGYLMDGTTIEASEGAIAQYLVDVAEKSGARRVHVIAHSMGNRGLLGAMNAIVREAAARTDKRFGQIILAAPDVDAQTFRQLASAYETLAERTTLYVSPADLAVRASRLVNGADRIGFTPPVPVIADIDTISVEKVDLTLLGHGYVGSSDEVLGDMHELLKDGSPPDQRFRLMAATTPEQARYWRFRA